MTRNIDSVKKNLDKFLAPGDRSYTMINSKEAVVRYGADIYVCDIQEGDPESCALRQRICEVDDETFSKVEDFAKKEAESIAEAVGKMGEKRDIEDSMIPDNGQPKKLTDEEQKQMDEDNVLIPDGKGEPGEDDDMIP